MREIGVTDLEGFFITGRTGRFGRQGVSINFVHDRQSFQDMEAIRKALGKAIVRVDTSDFEQMEAVSCYTERVHATPSDCRPPTDPQGGDEGLELAGVFAAATQLRWSVSFRFLFLLLQRGAAHILPKLCYTFPARP